MSYGDIKIKSVSVFKENTTYCDTIQIAQPTYSDINNYIKNQNLSFSQFFIGGEDENILYILFQNTLYPDERIQVTIGFEVKLPNVNHRFGYGNNTVNLANFYPIACVFDSGDFDTSLYHSNGDPFYSEMSNYKVILKANTDFKIANTGYVTSQSTEIIEETNLSEENESTEKIVYTINAEAVRDFAIVMSKEFQILSQMVGETEVKYYYFSDDNPTLSLETSVKSLQTFNELIGQYPYKTLSVVEANFLHGGMEYPNLVYISNEITEEVSYQQVIVHEIAHQWWYNLVGNNEFGHAWLDEGLTEYSTALFYELHPEYNVSKDTLITNAYNSYSLFVEIYGKVYGDVDTSMNRSLDEFPTSQEYVYIAYVKGMLLFDSLREILGYKKFVNCIQGYFADNIYQIATPADLISSFEKTSNSDLESYLCFANMKIIHIINL
jgi:hypothetical protein